MLYPCKNRLIRSFLFATAACASALGLAGGARAAALLQEKVESNTAIVRGTVVDARSGAALDRAQVRIRDTDRKTETGRDGRFELGGVEPGRLMLEVSVVNYALVRRPVEIAPGQIADITIRVVGGAGTLAETVVVTASAEAAVVPARQVLDGVELQRLSGGMMEDPVRAVQTLPGVTTGDDFRSEFSVRGSGPRNIGTTFEGITTSLLTHTWHQEDDGSGSMVNSAVVDRMSLVRGAYLQREGGRTGAWLDITMREGSRDRFEARGSVSMTSASVAVGGPLGAQRRGSYLVAGRVNYIDKLLQWLNATGKIAGFSLLDSQGKVVYDLSDRHQFQLAWLAGRTRVNMEHERPYADPNDDLDTTNATELVTGALRSTFGARLMLTHRLGIVANDYRTEGFFHRDLQASTRREFTYRGDLAAAIRQSIIEAGFATHRSSQAFESTLWTWADPVSGTIVPVRHDQFDAGAWRHGGYVLLRWNEWPRLTFSPGVRVDRFSLTRETVLSPWFQANWMPRAGWEVALGCSVNHQFPDFSNVAGLEGGGAALRAERAVHTDLAVSHALDERTRVRITLYNRSERNGLRRRDSEIQLYPWGIHWPGMLPIYWANALEGYSRGVELELRSADPNGLSGWISYTLAFTRFRDREREEMFWGDFDQRHTANLFGQYRWSPHASLSARFRFGSNYPLAGYYESRRVPLVLNGEMFGYETIYTVSATRNTERLPAYARLDLRLDRTFSIAKGRLMLFAEVTNVFGRENQRQELHGYWRRPDGLVKYNSPLASMFPFMPSGGVLIEF